MTTTGKDKPLVDAQRKAAQAARDRAEVSTTTPTPALPAANYPKPNIKFCGRKVWDREKRKVLKDPKPIEVIRTDGRTIELPGFEFQKNRRLFYHKDATAIVRLFPKLYKRVINKRS